MVSFSTFFSFLSAFLFVQNVNSLASTDTITWGGDNSRAGYQTNHNMDPSVVAGSSFGQLWRAALPGNFNGIGPEQIFSQPLVYTGGDGIQYVYIATTQNNIYKINAKTGAIVTSRNIHVPFLTADLDGCVDINPAVGVTATGVIDPDTGIWYFTSKTYSEQFQDGNFSPKNPPGRLNGRYYFHAINTADLSEVSGFPKLIDGLIFRNNPNRMFIGGNQHARPGMLQVGDYIYTGWASHCVQYNFTGALIGFHRTTGAVVEAFAMEGGPEPNTVKGAGVWMSGGGLAYDGKGSIFLASGNGYASQLAATGDALPGRQPPTSLEEAAVNFAIQGDGTLKPVDFFMPWEKTQLDGADKDLGTSPLELLPNDVFKCANVKRMGVVTGKSGKTYWLNLDNLGGYQMGPNRLDAAIQVYQNENSVYAGAGVMPLGGGYVFINVIQYKTHVFKFSCSAGGDPQFTLVSNTPEKNAYILGVGHGTTTSLNGQEGTGLLWTTDVEGYNLRIYDAIPPSDGGDLKLLRAFNIPGVTKFSRPVFGNGIAYVGTTQGYLYAFGSPVNLPLNCSSPYTFPNTAVGSTSSPITVTCKALIGVTVTGVALTGNANFKISPVSTPITLAAGQTFSLNATFTPGQVGLLSSDIQVNTTNNVEKYSGTTPVTLKGTANSQKPLLAIAPNTVSFNVVAGQQVDGVTQSSLFSNRGDGPLTVQSITYSTTSETGPWVTPNITGNGTVQVGYFTFSNVPTTIDGNSVATVNINYNPAVAGNHAVYVKVITDGGNGLLDVVGVAGTNPVALIEFQTPDGSGWATYQPGVPFSFGNVTENQTKNLKMRITDNGTGSAVPLSLTVSKPPYGVSGIVGAVNNIDLAEGTLLQGGQSQTATLYCSVPRSQVNVPSYNGSAVWTLNTGDPNMGKQIIQFSCNAVSEQVGPLLSNGTARYQYAGCFRENNPGRQLAVNPLNGADMTNDKCIAQCFSLGYTFAGTQYQSQCWCGAAIPILKDNENDCNYNCAGNENQTCGGNGYFHNQSQLSLFADSTKFDGNTTSKALQIVPSYNGYNYIGCYAETGGKTVSAANLETNTMTVEACGDYCISKGYKLFGLEYASQCACGNTIAASSKLTDDKKCSMTCKGSNSEYCGAGSLMSLYGYNMSKSDGSASSSISSTSATGTTTSSSAASSSAVPSVDLAGYTYMGCYNETHDRRALNGPARGGVNTNTLESCASFCAGYSFFGVEYGSECFCSTSIYVNSIKQSSESGCSMKCAGNSAQNCGGPDFLNVYYTNATASSSSSVSSQVSTSAISGISSTAAGTTTSTSASATPTGPSAKQTVGSYVYQGCYTETPGRTLSAKSFSNSSNSLEFCASFCTGYTYFATEYQSECYCSDTLNSASVLATDGRCNMKCAADQSEYCGGPNGLSLYKKSADIASSSSSSLTSSSSSVAISSSSSADLATSSSSASSVSSSASSMATISSSSSSTVASKPSQTPLSCPSSNGTTYTSSNGNTYLIECFNDRGGFDISMVYTSTLEACLSSCDTLTNCKDVSWVAGGGACYRKSKAGSSNSNNGVWGAVLQPAVSSSSSVASITSTSSILSSSSSTSSGSIANPGSANIVSMGSSVASSTSSVVATSSASSSISSVSSSATSSDTSSSMASTSISSDGASVSTVSSSSSTASSSSSDVLSSSSSSSDVASSSSSSSIVAPSTTSSSVASSSLSSSTSTSATSTRPIAVPTVSGYVSQGCYNEPTNGRALAAASFTNSTGMTAAMCASFCSQYAWFGVEYSVECFCGPYVRSGSKNVTDSDCNMPCAGNKTTLCGAGNRLNMYYNNDTTKASTDPMNLNTVGNYQFYNCVKDNPRVLNVMQASDSMSVDYCQKLATAGGYTWFGVEYGRECYMSSSLASGAQNATLSDCNMACKGNPGQLCGAGNRLSMYKKSS